MSARNRVRTARTARVMMYFLKFFQMRKMKVFIGLTNQLKLVVGRLEGQKKPGSDGSARPKVWIICTNQTLASLRNDDSFVCVCVCTWVCPRPLALCGPAPPGWPRPALRWPAAALPPPSPADTSLFTFRWEPWNVRPEDKRHLWQPSVHGGGYGFVSRQHSTVTTQSVCESHLHNSCVCVCVCALTTMSRKVLPRLSVYSMCSGFMWLHLSFLLLPLFLPFFLAFCLSFSSLSKSAAVFRRVSGHQPFIFLARKMENRGLAQSLASSMVQVDDCFAPRTMSLSFSSMEPDPERRMAEKQMKPWAPLRTIWTGRTFRKSLWSYTHTTSKLCVSPRKSLAPMRS